MGTSITKAETVTQTGWSQKFGEVEYITTEGDPPFEGMRVVFQAKAVESIYQTWEGIVKQLSVQEDIKNLIVLPISYSWKKEDHLCNCQKATVKEYQVIYNKIYTTLAHQLKLRIKRKTFFQECEVWYLAYLLIKVGALFEKKGFHLGNVHPKNIVINSDGIAQVFTIVSSPVERENCEEVKESKYNDAFLSPEETRSYKKMKINNNIDKNKVDSYYIGLVMLSLTSLKDLYFLFNHSDSTIKFGLLDELFVELRNTSQYSFVLYSLLRNMLQADPIQRMSPLGYYDIFAKYEKQILTMKQFYLSQSQIQQLTAIKSPQKPKIKRTKQISFLTLSQKNKEASLKTNIKIGKFKDDLETSGKMGERLYESRDDR